MPLDPLSVVPMPLAVALMLTQGDKTGPGIEVAQPRYMRKEILFLRPSDAAPGQSVMANVATTEWPRAISLWGVIGWLTAYEPDGTYFGWGNVVSPSDGVTPATVRIGRGDVARFRAAGLLITPGDMPPRHYGTGPYGAGPYSRNNIINLRINGPVSAAFDPSAVYPSAFNGQCPGVSQWVTEALP